MINFYLIYPQSPDYGINHMYEHLLFQSLFQNVHVIEIFGKHVYKTLFWTDKEPHCQATEVDFGFSLPSLATVD